jgi:hypothetical protein
MNSRSTTMIAYRRCLTGLLLIGLLLLSACGAQPGSTPASSSGPLLVGDAQVLRDGSSDWGSLQPGGHALTSGERIVVGQGNGATLTFPEGSTLFLQPGVEATMLLPQDAPSTLRLDKGTVRAQAWSAAFVLDVPEKDLVPVGSYNIFTVRNNEARTIVEVTSGSVELRGATGVSEQIAAGATASIAAAGAESATLEPTAAPVGQSDSSQAAPTASAVVEPTVAAEPTASPAPRSDTAAVEPSATTAPEAASATPEAVAPTSAPAPAPEAVATINDNIVALRDGPGTIYTVLARLSKGTQVSVLAEQEDWIRVRTADGIEGWVFSQLLSR